MKPHISVGYQRLHFADRPARGLCFVSSCQQRRCFAGAAWTEQQRREPGMPGTGGQCDLNVVEQLVATDKNRGQRPETRGERIVARYYQIHKLRLPQHRERLQK